MGGSSCRHNANLRTGAWTGLRQNEACDHEGGEVRVVSSKPWQLGRRTEVESGTSERAEDRWENSGTVDPDTLGQVQDSLTVDMIMTSRRRLVTCWPNEIVSAVVDANTKRYSYLPVEDENEKILGIFEAEKWFNREEEAPACTITDVYAPLSERYLIGAKASIVTFISTADDVPVRLVSGSEGIGGLVSISDLQKLPVRAALFTLVTSLEIAMSQRIDKAWKDAPDRWICLLKPNRRLQLKRGNPESASCGRIRERACSDSVCGQEKRSSSGATW